MISDKVEKKSQGEYFPHVISEYQNPYQYPMVDPRYKLDAKTTLTIGDLHSNSVVLLGILIKHNVLHISKEDFDILAAICLKVPHEITIQDMQTFGRILAFSTLNTTEELGTLCFLGDEVADRNDCTLWILLILQTLHVAGVKYVITFSNHGFEFISNYEKDEPFAGNIMEKSHLFIESLTALETIIQNGLVQRSVINHLIETYYLPHLKLVDYSIGKDNKLTYYTHSHAGRVCFMNLAYEFYIENYADFEEGTTYQRIEILENIQSIFLDHVKNKTVHTLIEMNGEEESPSEWSETARLIWGRTTNWIGRHKDDRHVNGHDVTNPKVNVVLLDNLFGKFPYRSGICTQYQTYKALYTHENKKFDYWYFKDALNTIKNSIKPYIKNTFAPENLEILLDEKDIFSSFHIETLTFLLCDDNAFTLWKFLSYEVNHLEKIIRNRELRDCIYLLHTMGLLTENSIFLCMKQEDYKLFFTFLLLLKESNIQLLEDKVQYFLSIPVNLQKELYTILLELRHSNELDESVLVELIQMNQDVLSSKRIYTEIVNYLNRILLPTHFNVNWLTSKDIEQLYSKLYFDFSICPHEVQKTIRDICKTRILDKIDYLLGHSEFGITNPILKRVALQRLPELIHELYEKNENRIYHHHKEIHLLVCLFDYLVNFMHVFLDDDLLLFIIKNENAFKNIGLMWKYIYEINNYVTDDLLKSNCINVFANGKGKQILSWFIFLQTPHENQKTLLTADNFILGINLAFHGFLEDSSLISHLEASKEKLVEFIEQLILMHAQENLNLETMKEIIGYAGIDTLTGTSSLRYTMFRPFDEKSDESDSNLSHDF